MNHEHDSLVDKLKQLNPVDRTQYESWVRTEGGRFLRQRVENLSRGAKRNGRPRSRALWGYAAVTVVVIAVAAVLLAVPLGEHTRIVPTSNGGVVQSEVLSRLVSVAVDQGRAYRPLSDTPKDGGSSSQLAQVALELHLLTTSEATTFDPSKPVTRSQFAVWIWRGFGPRLRSTTSAHLRDIGHLTAEEQDAIAGVVRAGILELSSNGSFRPGAPVTQKEEEAAFERLGQATGSSSCPSF